MRRLNALLALAAGPIHAQLLPMNQPSRRIDSSLPEGNTSPALFLRQTATDCAKDTRSCDSGCIPEDGQCCSAGDGGWCGAGTSCESGGCCPNGDDCSGPAKSCGQNRVFCGDKCMPEGAACCSGENYFCGSGTTCTDDGLCSDMANGPGCGSDEESCGSGCIPSGQVCCGTYHCPVDYACGDADYECASRSGGGETDGDGDGGDAAMCVGDFEACGSSCMPRGGTCCDGFFCGAGEKCGPRRKCEVTDGSDAEDGEEGDDEGDGGGGSPSAATTEDGARPPATDEPGGARRLTICLGVFLAPILGPLLLIS